MEQSERLIEIINSSILLDEDFQEALKIVKDNSFGKIWLVGGFLYKNIASSLYSSQKSTKDFDLVVEEAKSNLILPEGWKITTNHFDGIKFVNGKKEIDFMPLANLYYIKNNHLSHCINNFLEGGGLNIHCLAYDILGEKVVGDVGIKALEDKVISAYNLEMLEYGARLYGKTSNEVIRQKAKELGFEARLV
ncbi:MAG: hypothetical protein WAU65_02770 [Candidatus Nanoarchaeia archaeon]